MTKLFMGFISGNDELLKDVKILDQMVKIDNPDYKEIYENIRKYMGGSIFHSQLYVNYQCYNQLMKYDVNTIKLILPPEVGTTRIDGIVGNIYITMGYDIKQFKTIGYWIDSSNMVQVEYNTIIEFKTRSSELILDYIIEIMGHIKNEYSQEATAFYFNDSLLLV